MITENDFPAYQVLLKLNKQGIEAAKKAFAEALSGDFAKEYNFALGIQTIAADPDIQLKIPEMTPDVVKQTLRSCLRIFKQGVEFDHEYSKDMVDDYSVRGLGQ